MSWVAVCEHKPCSGKQRCETPAQMHQLWLICSSYRLHIRRNPADSCSQLLSSSNISFTAFDRLNICFYWCISKKTLVSQISKHRCLLDSKVPLRCRTHTYSLSCVYNTAFISSPDSYFGWTKLGCFCCVFLFFLISFLKVVFSLMCYACVFFSWG